MSEELTGLTHSEPRVSEVEALAVVAPHLTAMKREIMNVIVAAGEHGMTPDEYAQASGAIINTVRRRFTDLWHEGRIRPTDRVRKNARGNNETVWVVGRDEFMVDRETKDQKIKRLEARIVELEERVQGLNGDVREAGYGR